MIALVETQRTVRRVPVAVSCRALGLSESWFYKHHGRPPTRAQERRRELDRAIERVFTENDGEYGSPRVHAELIERERWRGLSVNTVAERMRELGLHARHRPRRRSLTRPTRTPRRSEPAGAQLQARRAESGLVQRYHGDPDVEGALYLASVIDLYSRRLIGYALAEHCKAPLVCDALKMALATRGGLVAGVVIHSDRGSQYTSDAFTGLCARHRITQSMSRSGSCLDNAPAEAFFASLKTELAYRVALSTRRHARQRVVRWLERYNRVRRHSHCGYKAPLVYETLTADDTPALRRAA